MIGDDNESATNLQRLCSPLEEFFEGPHFVIHFNSQCLVDFCKHLVLLEGRKGLFDCIMEITGGPNIFSGAGRDNHSRHPGSSIDLSVHFENLFNLRFAIGVENICGSLSTFGIHPHVKFCIPSERESPFSSVELVRRDSEICQDAVESFVDS